MTFLASAIIGGVAAVAGAAINSHATSKASDAATKAATDNNALARENRDINIANFQPEMNRGNVAGDTLSAFLGLGGDPAKSQAAFDTYLKSTGYQFGFNQGRDAITGSRATAGLLKSGSTLKALDRYGTNYAQAVGVNPFLAQLQQLTSQGVQAKSAIAGIGQNFVTQTSANNDSAATNVGNAALAGANNSSNLLGQLVQGFNQTRGQSSWGQPSQGAISSSHEFRAG